MTTTRLLTIEDADKIAEVLRTRDHMWKQQHFDIEGMIRWLQTSDPYSVNIMGTKKEVVGVFEDDGTLDAFSSLVYPDIPSIRADDQTKTEPCAIGGIAVTRRKFGRKKNDAGWDVNYTILNNAIIQRYWDNGRFSHWTLMPLSYNRHQTNPDFENFKNYIVKDIEGIKAGELAVGPHAFFIRSFVAGKKFEEDVSIRLSTLPDEFRPK